MYSAGTLLSVRRALESWFFPSLFQAFAHDFPSLLAASTSQLTSAAMYTVETTMLVSSGRIPSAKVRESLLQWFYCSFTSIGYALSLFQPQSSVFVPTGCGNSSNVGVHCNTSGTPCDILQPCYNLGICNNSATTLYGYNCLCVAGFSGINCQIDQRLCTPSTCWNSGRSFFSFKRTSRRLSILRCLGTCTVTSNKTFLCSCAPGWQGTHCETMINYCAKEKCLSDSVCRPSLQNFTCQCLGDSYSGRHCEITNHRTTVLQIVSKSFAYVSILAITTLAVIIVSLDVLKYVFHIDPVQKELRQKQRAKRRRTIIVMRYIYVHGPTEATTTSSSS